MADNDHPALPSVPARSPARMPFPLGEEERDRSAISHMVRLHALERTDRTRKSAFRGVQWCAERSNWRSAITDPRVGKRNGRTALGAFQSQAGAAQAYDLALIALDHEPVNFPMSHYQQAWTDPDYRRWASRIIDRLQLSRR